MAKTPTESCGIVMKLIKKRIAKEDRKPFSVTCRLILTKKGENENDLVTMVGSVGGTLGMFIGFSKSTNRQQNR